MCLTVYCASWVIAVNGRFGRYTGVRVEYHRYSRGRALETGDVHASHTQYDQRSRDEQCKVIGSYIKNLRGDREPDVLLMGTSI